MSAAVLARTSRGEWIRIWSVRSSWVFTLVTTVAVVGLGTIIGRDAAADPSGISAGSTAWDGGRFTGMFALFGMLAMAVVTTTADHGTGGIVPTLQWTPRRGVLLAARAGVVIATTTVIGVVVVGAASAVVWSFVPDLELPLREGVELLGGLGLLLACGAGLAVGVGLLLRSAAGGLVTVIALVLVLPMLLAPLPYDWVVEIAAVMPGSSALFLVFGEGPTDDMTTTSARLTLAAWAAGALLAGGWRLVRSDANR